eukprot:TRINITY_DN7581_c1_g3_i3.p1 TRINITY_DN7581_c1_g3~~TRINITY_DN7581_c1_g3_i3.p1  ORF type:complete len:341 (-),score=13.89 TRINITY_DN7581_c1_g3_i3:4-888(-)
MAAVFGTDDQEKVCLEILEKGEYQVSDKEREAQASALLRDITCLVAERTVNPQTHRPYPTGMVEKFIKDVHFSVDPNRSSKQQALDLIRQLSQRFPIARARMEVRLVAPAAALRTVQAELGAMGAMVRGQAAATDDTGAQMAVVCQIEPGQFRQVDALMQRVRGHLEVRAAAVQQEGDLSFDALDDNSSDRQQRSATDSSGSSGRGGEAAEEGCVLLEPGAAVGVQSEVVAALMGSVSLRDGQGDASAAAATAPAAAGAAAHPRHQCHRLAHVARATSAPAARPSARSGRIRRT